MVLQYLVSGGEAPVLAAKTLVLRAIAGVGRRGGGVGVEEGGGRGGSSISTPLRLRSAQLALHLGNELTRLFSFLNSPSEKNDKNLGEELVDRFKCLAVAFLGELKIVPHVMVGDTLVNLTKSSVTHNIMQCLCDPVGIGPQKRLHVDGSHRRKDFYCSLERSQCQC